MDNVAFLVDITSHLNELNLRLQGKDCWQCSRKTGFNCKMKTVLTVSALDSFLITDLREFSKEVTQHLLRPSRCN